MKPITGLAGLAVLAVLAAVTTIFRHTVPTVYASAGCTNATLNGNYAVIQPAGFTSLSNSTAGREVSWQFVAIADFKGDGNFSADWTAAVNGTISGEDLQKDPQHATGTYSVNSDCTGSLSLIGPDAAGSTANLVVIGSGAEIFGIWTNPGSTASFDAKKQ